MNLSQLREKYTDEASIKLVNTFVTAFGKDDSISDDQVTHLEQIISMQAQEREEYSRKLAEQETALKDKDEKLKAATEQSETLTTQFETFQEEAKASKTQLEQLVAEKEADKRVVLVDSVIARLRNEHYPVVVDAFEEYARMELSTNQVFKYERPGKEEGDDPIKVEESVLMAMFNVIDAIPAEGRPQDQTRETTPHANPKTKSDLEKMNESMNAGTRQGLMAQGYSGAELEKEMQLRGATVVSNPN